MLRKMESIKKDKKVETTRLEKKKKDATICWEM